MRSISKHLSPGLLMDPEGVVETCSRPENTRALFYRAVHFILKGCTFYCEVLCILL